MPALMERGLTDNAIGRQLGVTERTVRRMMARVMDRLEAKSRFQAGVLAVRNDWL